MKELAPGRSIGSTVVERVAAADGVDPLELDPLYESIDPDVLDRLFDPLDRISETTLRVVFEYAGHTVSVEGAGTVTLDSVPRAAEGTSPADSEVDHR